MINCRPNCVKIQTFYQAACTCKQAVQCTVYIFRVLYKQKTYKIQILVYFRMIFMGFIYQQAEVADNVQTERSANYLLARVCSFSPDRMAQSTSHNSRTIINFCLRYTTIMNCILIHTPTTVAHTFSASPQAIEVLSSSVAPFGLLNGLLNQHLVFAEKSDNHNLINFSLLN